MIYIGLACSYHDPAIAVVSGDGEILFAEATERALQMKRAFHCAADHFPHVDSVLDRYCQTGDDLVIAKSWGQGGNYWRRLSFALNTITTRGLSSLGPESSDSRRNRFLAMGQFSNIVFSGENLLHRYGRRYPDRHISVVHHDHHLTHAAYACYTSPFNDAVCAVIDGFGEESSTAFYRFADGLLHPIEPERLSRNSLGHFYNRLCSACGFDPDKGDQWKVMGLAATGHLEHELYEALRGSVTVDGLELVGRDRMRSCRVWERSDDFPKADIAHAGQVVFEEAMTTLLRNLRTLDFSENLVLTGGCALNSTYNGKILGSTGFSRLYIPSAPADDGNAIGAAFLSYLAGGGSLPRRAWQTPYLGSVLSDTILNALARHARKGTVTRHASGIEHAAAQALAEGKIVGWAQGAAEFGPRALGNRSILGNPTHPNTAERLRSAVKTREEFRPFAPAILHEYGSDYFRDYQESPYMERTLQYKPSAAARVAAVVHSDNTGRIQTVKREWNPRFHCVVDSFRRLTGVPLVLNTSMNISGRPIVHSIEDAIGLFHTTGLDLMFIGDCCIRK
jgi:carbamoyltransferase